MENNFEKFGLKESVLKSIIAKGYKEPTEVQLKAIEPLKNNKDIIVKSKTGSGKTAAFSLPIINNIDGESKNIQALILAPTRELAVQVNTNVVEYSKHTLIKSTTVYGQHNIETEIKQLEKGKQIVAGTPGRVLDHIQRGTINTEHIKYFVLDEADVMLNMGFLDQVEAIIDRLPKDRVTALFSASMPEAIVKMSNKYMDNSVFIEIESDTQTVDSITQFYYRIEGRQKRYQLKNVIVANDPESCIIFSNTRAEVDRIVTFLREGGFPTIGIHGQITQTKRLKSIKDFKEKKYKFLVATDVASRGIHIDDVTHVINYDLPVENDSYIHRIGRTGRAGNGGVAISMVTDNDIMSLYEVEEHIGAMIQEKDLPSKNELNKLKSDYNFVFLDEEGHSKPGKSHDRRSYKKPSTNNKSYQGKGDSTRPTSKKPYEKKTYEKKPYEHKTQEAPKTKKYVNTNKNTKKKEQAVVRIDARDYMKAKRKAKISDFFSKIFGKKNKS